MKRTRTLVATAALVGLFSGSALAEEPSVEIGQQTFKTFCATCHGAEGKGDGPAGAALTPTPRDFTSPEFWKTADDAKLKLVITKGGAAAGLSPMMAPWGGVLKPHQVDSVLLYMKATFRPTAPAPATPPAQ